MNDIAKFQKFYLERKKIIEDKIELYHNELGKESQPIILNNIDLFTKLNSDGKRIRGILVNLGYSLLKDDIDYSVDLSLAYELFQTAILVHDDVIDHDEKRRGDDTIHYANQKKNEKYSLEDSKTLGEAVAICMGDFGLYKANQYLVQKYHQDSHFAEILDYFYQIVLTTIRGELLDVVLPFEGKYELLDLATIQKNILEIYRLKTSYYTIIGPLVAGMLLAGGDEEKIDDIKSFGEKAGIAFQIQDDVLGIFSENTGKVQGSDIREFKQTILYSHILSTPYKDEFLKYYGSSVIDEDIIHKVQELLKKSGSYQYAIDMMKQMYDDALVDLDKMEWITKDKKDILKGFVDFLRNRDM